MKRTRRRHLGALALAAAVTMAAPLAAIAADPDTPFGQDGWYRWQVEAVGGVSDWCCYRGSISAQTRITCQLDGRDMSYGGPGNDTSASRPTAPRTMNLFAEVQNGAIGRVRVLSADCATESRQPTVDLGAVPTTRSLAWLMDASERRRTGGERNPDAVMAIAVHRGPEAREALVRIARQGPSSQLRQDAIFWMGQLRVEETRHELLDLMANDDSRKIREQAIFAYAQSPAPDRLAVLTDIIEDRNRDMNDRKQALFWLVQDGDPSGIEYVQSLLASG